MWCDNCLLLFPLRSGAMAWATLIFLYSTAGGIFLIEVGCYLFFVYPEWEIYGGVAFAVAFVAVITIFALGSRSPLWIQVVKAAWPFIFILAAIRDIILIVELQRGQSKIEWECVNGGQLWPASAAAGYGNGTIPSTFCTEGFSNVNAAFIVSVLVDLGCQIYMYFLIWRFSVRLQNEYNDLQGPYSGGMYYYNKP